MRRSLLIVCLMLVFAAGPAHASGMRFGTQEDIHFIQDVTLKGAKQEPLYLGYMTATKNFLAGLYVEDKGYVLGVKGESGRYYHMPQGEELAGFQRNGFLPNPLPTYKLSFLDYLVGYSAWIILIVALGWGAFSYLRKSRAPQPAATAGAPLPPQDRPPTVT